MWLFAGGRVRARDEEIAPASLEQTTTVPAFAAARSSSGASEELG
jgi:hypothetical protein